MCASGKGDFNVAVAFFEIVPPVAAWGRGTGGLLVVKVGVTRGGRAGTTKTPSLVTPFAGTVR